MTRRAFVRSSASAAVFMSLEGCGLSTTRCGFELSCTVTAGPLILSGQSVIEVFSTPEIVQVGDGPVRHTDMKGEALVVPAPRSPLFLTFTVPGGAGTLPVAIVTSFYGKVTDPDDFGRKLKALARGESNGREAALGRSDLPRLVTFGNLNNPSSVEEIVIGRDGESPVGHVIEDVTLKCRVTSRAVTHQLSEYIPWIYRIGDNDFKPGHSVNDWSLAATISRQSFIRS